MIDTALVMFAKYQGPVDVMFQSFESLMPRQISRFTLYLPMLKLLIPRALVGIIM